MKSTIKVEGMSCSACKAYVDRTLTKHHIEGNVSLIDGIANIEYDETKVNLNEVLEELTKNGYKSSLYVKGESDKKIKDYAKIKLFVSLGLMFVLFYFAMFRMWKLPMLNVFKENYGLYGIVVQIVLALAIILINFKYYLNGAKKLFKLHPNMDSLVFMGSFISFVYAFINFIRLIIALTNKNNELAMHYSMNLYFESSAMILVFVSIGKYLEGISKKKTRESLDALVKMLPSRVTIVQNEKEVEVDVREVKKGDVIFLKPYEFVLFDGEVVKGESNFDTSKVSGESLLSRRGVKDELVSGYVNQSESLYYRVSKTLEDSYINQVIKMVEEAMNSKMPISKIADRVSLYFVPFVILASLVVFIIYMFITHDFKISLDHMISLLVISCPCSLGLATPLSVYVISSQMAKNNILIKESKTIENLSKIDSVIFDKTGTLTEGKMKVNEVYSYSDDFLDILSSLENLSNHPLSFPLKKLGKVNYDVSDYEVILGKGIKGKVNGKVFYASNKDYLKSEFNLQIDEKVEELEKLGKSVVILATSEKVYGYVAIYDAISENAKKTIECFHKLGKEVILASGDSDYVVSSVAKDLKIDKYYGKMLPLDKGKIIDELHQSGKKVLMVGDGINDIYAMSKADVSISCDVESDITSNSSDIILTKKDILLSFNAYRLALKCVKNIKVNLLWAFLYNVIAMPVAAGALEFINIKMSPAVGALCMSISSICVCLNALRLKFIKMEEVSKMKLEFYVKDMMCNHCVAHVKEALTKEGIENVEIDLASKLVKVETSLDKETVYDYVRKANYKVEEK